MVTFRFVDGGQRGIGKPDIRPDSVQLDIRGAAGACNLSLAGSLGGGNLRVLGKAQAPR